MERKDLVTAGRTAHPLSDWMRGLRAPPGRGLLTLYGVGLAGQLAPWEFVQTLMAWLTIPALLVGGAIVLAPRRSDRTGRFPFAVWFVGVMAAGFTAEAVGVATGRVFGAYSYGEVLGWKIAGVPPVIAWNWAVLTLGAAELARRLVRARWAAALLAGVLLALFDVLLEPAAIRLGYWQWKDILPPLQNFVAWGVLGALFAFPLPRSEGPEDVATPAVLGFLVQGVYFAVLYLRFDVIM